MTDPTLQSTRTTVRMKLRDKLQTDAWNLINQFVTPEQAHLIWMHEDIKFKAYYIFNDTNRTLTSKKQALAGFIKRYYTDIYIKFTLQGFEITNHYHKLCFIYLLFYNIRI